MGDGKERTSVSLDREVVDQLDDFSDNRSAVINRLLREYVASGGDGPIGLEIRLQDIERKIDAAMTERDRINRRISRLRNQKEQVEREIEQRQEKKAEQLREAREKIPERDPDNLAVQNWAEKLGMTPTELLSKIEEIDA